MSPCHLFVGWFYWGSMTELDMDQPWPTRPSGTKLLSEMEWYGWTFVPRKKKRRGSNIQNHGTLRCPSPGFPHSNTAAPCWDYIYYSLTVIKRHQPQNYIKLCGLWACMGKEWLGSRPGRKLAISIPSNPMKSRCNLRGIWYGPKWQVAMASVGHLVHRPRRSCPGKDVPWAKPEGPSGWSDYSPFKKHWFLAEVFKKAMDHGEKLREKHIWMGKSFDSQVSCLIASQI